MRIWRIYADLFQLFEERFLPVNKREITQNNE